jgi:hypothetical protein
MPSSLKLRAPSGSCVLQRQPPRMGLSFSVVSDERRPPKAPQNWGVWGADVGDLCSQGAARFTSTMSKSRSRVRLRQQPRRRTVHVDNVEITEPRSPASARQPPILGALGRRPLQPRRRTVHVDNVEITEPSSPTQGAARFTATMSKSRSRVRLRQPARRRTVHVDNVEITEPRSPASAPKPPNSGGLWEADAHAVDDKEDSTILRVTHRSLRDHSVHDRSEVSPPARRALTPARRRPARSSASRSPPRRAPRACPSAA